MATWTPQEDSLLQDAMALYGDKWLEIKKFMGRLKKVAEIKERASFLKPKQPSPTPIKQKSSVKIIKESLLSKKSPLVTKRVLVSARKEKSVKSTVSDIESLSAFQPPTSPKFKPPKSVKQTVAALQKEASKPTAKSVVTPSRKHALLSKKVSKRRKRDLENEFITVEEEEVEEEEIPVLSVPIEPVVVVEKKASLKTSTTPAIKSKLSNELKPLTPSPSAPLIGKRKRVSLASPLVSSPGSPDSFPHRIKNTKRTKKNTPTPSKKAPQAGQQGWSTFILRMMGFIA